MSVKMEVILSVIVIVGAGQASAEAIASLRSKNCQDKIVLIGEEDSLPYQRPPLSKGYFKGDIEPENLLLKAHTFYEQANIELKLGCRVDSIERNNKTLLLNNGEVIAYDKLILATGTRPRALPNIEEAKNNIFYLRTKSDVDKIKKHHRPHSKMLIIGAGYIGLEIAAAAAAQQTQVTIVEAADRVLARVTSPVLSEFYQKLHRDNGVDILLSTQVKGFISDDNGTKVILDNKTVEFDIAIVGIGVLPNSELASDANLACDDGITVDQYTRTEDPDIYAIGDCSNHPSTLYDRRVRLESVPNAIEQAKVAAANLCGESAIHDSVPWFWSDQYNIKLQTVGLLQGYDQIVLRGDIEKQKFSVFYLKQGQLIAMDAINSPADFMQSKKIVQQKIHPAIDALADSNVPLKTLLT